MPVRFDHLLVAATDKHRSAQFFADMFGLSAPTEAGFFVSGKRFILIIPFLSLARRSLPHQKASKQLANGWSGWIRISASLTKNLLRSRMRGMVG